MLSRTALIINRRITLTTTINSQKISNRSIHLSHRLNTAIITRNSTLKLGRYSPIVATPFIRGLSTEGSSGKAEVLGSILQTAKNTAESSTQTVTDAVTTTNIVESVAPIAAELPGIPVEDISPIAVELFSIPVESITPIVEELPSIPAESITPIAAEIPNIPVESVTPITAELPSIPAENITPIAAELPSIPDAPAIPVPPEALETLSVLGEPTFESLGLGSWWPPGLIQQLFEMVHVGMELPWWTTIIIGTITIRTLLFPLIIYSQRNAARMHNTMPGMQKIQQKITEARSSGDQMGMMIETRKLMAYMKDNNCNPIKNMIVPMCQAPIFLSFFLGLRGMANLPVESMKTGGLWWFENLTVPDPYYLLPLLTVGTLALTVRLGIDAPQMNSMGMMKYVVNAMPIVILPFTINFPSALTFYWALTNIYGLVQVSILKIPQMRTYFKIPARITHNPDNLLKPKKFKEGFKDSWTNMKLAREMTAREQIDTVQFNKAGRGPIQKTYAYNPLQAHLKKPEVMAKKN